MNWRLLRNHLANQYHERPQEVARIDYWLRQAQEALQGLGSMGHQMHLASGPQPTADEWPRLVYNLDSAPRGFLCLCEQDFELLGPGWFDTLDEAKQADGMGEQFKRGGIFPKSGVPARTDELTPLDLQRKHGLD